jgi:hypothetical protein
MWRHHDVIMAVCGEDECKIFSRPKMNLRQDNMKYDPVVVFIRRDSTEIWGFRYGLKL